MITTIFHPGGRSEISARAETYHIIRPLGPDYVSRAGPVSPAGVSLPGSWHDSTSRLHDYRASPVSRDPGIAVPGSRLTGLKFFHVIAFAGLARPIKPARVQRVISIPYTS